MFRALGNRRVFATGGLSVGLHIFSKTLVYCLIWLLTLESVIDVGQEISVGPGRFGKKNKRRNLNKRSAWKIWKKE
jgi:hypothetical protein